MATSERPWAQRVLALPYLDQLRKDERARAIARNLKLGKMARASGLRPQPTRTVGSLRLVSDPVFVFSSTRSGSTLLRMILDTHTKVRAPHELHMNSFQVSPVRSEYVELPMKEMKLTYRDMENMLWDRVLYGQLAISGKRVIVDKTPHNSFDWERIAEYWPDARYIHLRRHPVGILESRIRSMRERPMVNHLRLINEWGVHLNAARAALPGPTIRYEDLTAQPEETVREICDYLGLKFEPGMLNYQTGKHSRLRPGLGDFSDTIKSGAVQPARPLPPAEEIPEELRELSRQWGYI